jgi:hypothetical protein
MGALFLMLIAWLGFSESGPITLIDKSMVGGAFIASCLFGISLALRPGWTRRSSRVGGHAYIADRRERSGRRMIGHHPDCGRFKGHVLEFRNKMLCSGCTGLASGSIAAIILTIAYIVFEIRIGPEILYSFVLIGILLVVLSFVDIIFSLGKSRLHNGLNIFLVIGFFLVVVGIHQMTGSAAFALIGIIVSFLWLDTRIQLSSLRHREICASCSQPCKAY